MRKVRVCDSKRALLVLLFPYLDGFDGKSRDREKVVRAVGLLNVFQTSRMTSTSGSGGGVGGALSFIGCVREASPPLEHRPLSFADFPAQQYGETLPKGSDFWAFIRRLFWIGNICKLYFWEMRLEVIKMRLNPV